MPAIETLPAAPVQPHMAAPLTPPARSLVTLATYNEIENLPALVAEILRCVPAADILVVDDNVDAAESMTMALELCGHETMAVHDGVAALQAAASFMPQVVLLDIGLPGRNGYEVAREIRRTPWGRDVLLIAATGWGQESDKQLAEDAGFDEHLTKPVDFGKLQALLPQDRA